MKQSLDDATKPGGVLYEMSRQPFGEAVVMRVGAPACDLCGARWGMCQHTGGPGEIPVSLAKTQMEVEEAAKNRVIKNDPSQNT